MDIPFSARIRDFEKEASRLLERASEGLNGGTRELLMMLTASENQQKELAKAARTKRAQTVGNVVVVRGSVEFSSHCRQQCKFCGMTSQNRSLQRYRLSSETLKTICLQAFKMGLSDIHLVSGEDNGLDVGGLGSVVEFAAGLGLEITLVLGQRTPSEYLLLRRAGATRYILKVETTNESAFREARTGTSLLVRVCHLLYLRSIGFQIGTGVICGLPGQSVLDLARDIFFFESLQPDMASVSRFLPNAESDYQDYPAGNHQLTLNTIAAIRLRVTSRNLRIPAGTTLDEKQSEALMHGANVISIHLTPPDVAEAYSADKIHTRTLSTLAKIQRLVKECGMSLTLRGIR